MPDWTIDGGDFSNATLAAAGITGLQYEITNGGQDRASFYIPGDADTTPPLTEKDAVTLAYDGTVRFRGFVRAVSPGASGTKEGIKIELDGAMMKLARSPYVQRRAISGAPGTYGYTTRCQLGYNEDGDRRNIAQTINDILDESADRHGLTTGTILSGHTVQAPVMTVTGTVLEALSRMLVWVPDAVLWFDHTANSVNVTKPANLTGVTKVGSGHGTGYSVTFTETNRRKHLPVPGVQIIWEITTEYNGESQIDTEVDSAGDPSGMDAVIHTIPISGGSITAQVENAKTADIPRSATDFTATQWMNWLRKKVPELKNWDTDYPNALAVLECTQTIDEDAKQGEGDIPEFGSPAAPSYPRELVSGGFPAWMTTLSCAPTSIRVKLRPHTDFASSPTLAKLFTSQEEKVIELQIDVTGTDAETQSYRTTLDYEEPDPIVTGLAAELYAALNADAPAGQIEFTGPEPVLDVLPGKKLTLTGDFAVTAAVVQSVTVHVDEGRTVVVYGPQPVMSPTDLVELLRASERRGTVSRAPGSPRTDAKPAGPVVRGLGGAPAKNTAVDRGGFGGGYFWPSLAGPQEVNIAEGLVIISTLSPAGCTSATLSGSHHVVDAENLISLTHGDYIWLALERAADGVEDTITLFSSSDTFITGSTVFNFLSATIVAGASLPTGGSNLEIWPLARYSNVAGVETVTPLHTGAAIPCPGIGYAKTVLECD